MKNLILLAVVFLIVASCTTSKKDIKNRKFNFTK